VGQAQRRQPSWTMSSHTPVSASWRLTSTVGGAVDQPRAQDLGAPARQRPAGRAVADRDGRGGVREPEGVGPGGLGAPAAAGDQPVLAEDDLDGGGLGAGGDAESGPTGGGRVGHHLDAAALHLLIAAVRGGVGRARAGSSWARAAAMRRGDRLAAVEGRQMQPSARVKNRTDELRRSMARDRASGLGRPRWPRASSRVSRSNNSSSPASGERLAWPPSARTMASSRRASPSGPVHQPVAGLAGQGAAGDGGDHGALQLGGRGASEALSRWRRLAGDVQAMAEISASLPSATGRGGAGQVEDPALQALAAPREGVPGSEHPPPVLRAGAGRGGRRAGPAASRSGSQSKRCRAVANWRVGLGWSNGSPVSPSRRAPPSRVRPGPASGGRARDRRGADRADGRPGRRGAGGDRAGGAAASRTTRARHGLDRAPRP
jgi:hypothetical protein